MRDTAVATVHSGNSSFARIILTSKSIVIHSILNVQLQKGAYLFLHMSHTILIPRNPDQICPILSGAIALGSLFQRTKSLLTACPQ